MMNICGRIQLKIKDLEGGQALVAYTFQTFWMGRERYKEWYDKATFVEARKSDTFVTENYLGDWQGEHIKNKFLTSGSTMFHDKGLINHINKFLDWVLLMSPDHFFVKNFMERLRLEVQG